MITTAELDSFNRDDENPLSQNGAWSSTAVGGGTWTWADGTLASPLRLLGNIATNQSAGDNAGSFRIATIPSGDCEVWGLLAPANIGNNEDVGLFLHLQDTPDDASFDGYLARSVRIGGFPDEWDIWRIDNGTATRIAINAIEDPLSGNQYMLFRRVGTALQVWRTDNLGAWTQMTSATDTNYSGGSLGLFCGTDDTGWAGFGGGAPREFVPQIIRYR